jgi:hypothetical protein
MIVGYTIADQQDDGTWRVGFWKTFTIQDGDDGSAKAYARCKEALDAINGTPNFTRQVNKIVTVMVPDEELA